MGPVGTPGRWREDLDAGTRARVEDLDAALGLCLSDAALVGALLDPRGPLFQRLEFVGDGVLDVTAVRELLVRERWDDDHLAGLTQDHQAMVSDRGLLRAARHARLPAVRSFAAGTARLGDRIEACVGAAWADAGAVAGESVARRLVVDPALAGEPVVPVRPRATGHRDGERTRRVQAALGHGFDRPGWLDWALEAGAHRRRLAQLGDTALEAAAACALYELHPVADEGELTGLRQRVGSNHRLARLAGRLQLDPRSIGIDTDEHLDATPRAHHGGDASHRRDADREAADAVQALVGAVVMDAGVPAGIAAGRRVLGLPPEDPLRRRDHRRATALRGRRPSS